MTTTRPSQVPAIYHTVLVRAEPRRVYNALTTSKGLDGWFTSGASVDPRPGGEMVWRWRDWGPDKITTETQGPVLEVERPKRFAFQWGTADPRSRTTVEVDFVAVPEGTVVRLKEYGYQFTEEGLQACLNCAVGWGEALTLLKVYVEHGICYQGDVP